MKLLINSKKFLIIGILFLVVGMFAGCSDDSTTNEDGTSNETSESEEATTDDTAEESTEESDKTYKVGDTVTVDKVEITINSASFTDPDEYSESKNGKVLTLDVTVKNTGEEQAFVDNTEFSIYDSDGNKQEDYYGYNDLAISDTINSGKQVQGKLYFDVVEQDSYEMIYTPSFSFDSKEVTFEIVPE